MILVEKIWEGIRSEGLGSGLPMVHIKLGDGTSYTSAEDLVRDILVKTRCRWVCLLGRDTTQVGMGTLIKGITSVGMSSEIEVDGTIRDPGWLHTADRWIVDYTPKPSFNLGALRSQDSVRFIVRDIPSLIIADNSLKNLDLFPGTKYIKLLGSTQDLPRMFNIEALRVARKYDRTRVYKGD